MSLQGQRTGFCSLLLPLLAGRRSTLCKFVENALLKCSDELHPPDGSVWTFFFYQSGRRERIISQAAFFLFAWGQEERNQEVSWEWSSHSPNRAVGSCCVPYAPLLSENFPLASWRGLCDIPYSKAEELGFNFHKCKVTIFSAFKKTSQQHPPIAGIC